jgi:hypothetical protein
MSEEARLTEILAPIQTIEDALATLGTPNFDGYSTSRQPERNNNPPSIERHRHIRYESLSKMADVWITERSDGKANWQLQGKFVGR